MKKKANSTFRQQLGVDKQSWASLVRSDHSFVADSADCLDFLAWPRSHESMDIRMSAALLDRWC